MKDWIEQNVETYALKKLKCEEKNEGKKRERGRKRTQKKCANQVKIKTTSYFQPKRKCWLNDDVHTSNFFPFHSVRWLSNSLLPLPYAPSSYACYVSFVRPFSGWFSFSFLGSSFSGRFYGFSANEWALGQRYNSWKM